MSHRITILPQKQDILASADANLLEVLRSAGVLPDAPCGGTGRCGKCTVVANGREVLACQTTVDRDMVITVPAADDGKILMDAPLTHPVAASCGEGHLLAFDIGTTTVAGYLLDHTGQELACASARNPQAAFGADVVSRIRSALEGNMEALQQAIGGCVSQMALSLCRQAGVAAERVHTISFVGNPAMQQLFLGIRPDNLVKIPFTPVLTKTQMVNAQPYFPEFPRAQLLVVPDISGYVGADTVAGILATGIHQQEEWTLLVDIGTNGEMVLGNSSRMVACATAAGPALEGANIQFGMRAQIGAIDHMWQENGRIQCSVIGGGEAVGICGSGLIDAVAVALELGWINQRGRIQTEDRILHLTDHIYLNQDDIRQLQLAKGAIAAGIAQLVAAADITLRDIRRVYLAGAFGTYMDPASACRIGLLPVELEEKMEAVGNAAGSGAKLLAISQTQRETAARLGCQVRCLELAQLPGFQRSFADHMRFDESQNYWIRKALALGFSCAAPLDVTTLQPRQDVRDMCAADKCGAYGKNWTCPPYCGTLEDCKTKLLSYSRGILLQTVGKLEKTVDTRAYRRTETQHLQMLHQLAKLLRSKYPAALCLGSGGCQICGKCAFPEPCRFPEQACASMEGYGLFVTQVCRDNGCMYHHGEKTITYTACILF